MIDDDEDDDEKMIDHATPIKPFESISCDNCYGKMGASHNVDQDAMTLCPR